jgi:hypothetical protein
VCRGSVSVKERRKKMRKTKERETVQLRKCVWERERERESNNERVET